MHVFPGARGVEDGTKEASRARRLLVRLLVAEVTVGKKPENDQTKGRITYRFGPPPATSNGGNSAEGDVFGDHFKKGNRS